MSSFFLQDPLEQVDPAVKHIIDLEEERQDRKLILIPSESSAPAAVRESLGSVLQNIYAEGYPVDSQRTQSEKQILDLENQLTTYYRYSDPRYYKGVEYADVLESLARKRCAELFANKNICADKIFVNVQALSGAPANNAVYQALIQPGDVVLGMNLFHGGHLTHGSSVNRSGKLYTVYHYSVNPDTELIDYKKVAELADTYQPKIIIAGYSSYPWSPSWKKLKAIAEKTKSYLFADVSHIAGLIASKVIPSPVGYADVITFTTHKTLCGPRGACILTFDETLSNKIDRAVFPGEQGGPHVQVFAAMATSFMLAATPQFASFQKQIVKNCRTLSDHLASRGLRIAYGGTDTHLLNIDCKSVVGEDGTFLSGDMASRVLDLVGLVVNANTIPGDKSSARASGIRIGTTWITQRGLVEADVVEMADIIADVLLSMKPYQVTQGEKSASRAKIDFKEMEEAKLRVKKIVDKALHADVKTGSRYPFYHFLDDFDQLSGDEPVRLIIAGEKASQSLNFILTVNTDYLPVGKTTYTQLFVYDQFLNAKIKKEDDHHFVLICSASIAGITAAWLRALSDGYIIFDSDITKRIPGPFIVRETNTETTDYELIAGTDTTKPYFIGMANFPEATKQSPLPEFNWQEEEEKELKRTVLYQWHADNNAKIIPFAGWEMPVWYTSVLEEHRVTRERAGLFDVTHMGVFEAQGGQAVSFLDCVCANDISNLGIGQSLYTHFLTPDAKVLDDLLVYRHEEDKYLLVVNAANEQKDWTWLNAVKKKCIQVERQRPWAHAYGTEVILRNLKDPREGECMRVNIALQGSLSNQVLQGAEFSPQHLARIFNLKKTELCHVSWNESDMIISRTGYTGEKLSYELFIHPDKALNLWEALVKAGTPLGMQACGLGARDSLRTEAGLPLYGHELAGEMELGVSDAGFGSYVKTYKPWFIGREAYLDYEKRRNGEVVRFKFEQTRNRIAHYGDPVFNEKGKKIGFVTSCAADKEGHLNGQAYIDRDNIAEGCELFIYQNAENVGSIKVNGLKTGDRIQLPSKGVVVSRFAKL